METYPNKENLAYKKATKRVKELKGFYGNLTSYCLIIPFLLVLNLFSSPLEAITLVSHDYWNWY